jgi:hypothetical protein
VALSNSQLATLIGSQTKTGESWSTTWDLLKTFGYKQPAQVAEQLQQAGWSQTRIEQAMHFHPGGLTQWWDSLKQAVLLPVPANVAAGIAAGAGGADAAAGAAAGAAGAEGAAAGAGGAAAGAGAAGAAKTIADAVAAGGTIALILAYGTRVLEVLAGFALLLLGLQALTGNGGNPISETTGVVRRVVKVAK